MNQDWLKDRISRSALQKELWEIKTKRTAEFRADKDKSRLIAETFDECIKEVESAFPKGQDRIGREALWKTLATKRVEKAQQMATGRIERADQTSLDNKAWTIAYVFEECINAVESAPPTDNWIPVGEWLPDDREDTYWVCTDGGYQCQCRWTNVKSFWAGRKTGWHWCLFDIPQYQKVIAWQPLPEPYKEPEISPEIFGRGI